MSDPSNNSPGRRPRADPHIGRVLVSAIRTAPRWGQIAIASATVAVAALTGIAIAGLAGTDSPGVRQQLLSIIIAHTGLLLLGIALFLYRMTQNPGRWRAIAVPSARIGTPRMHGLLLALPVVAFTAGTMLAAATALLLPSMFIPAGRPFILIGLIYIGVVVLAGRTVRKTTRFLYRYAREQTEAVDGAEREAADAKLSALQAQMNPHFLFNALNTVAALIATKPERAERTVEDLATVLRRTLDRSRKPTTTIAEEIDYLRSYVAIERERFGDRLRVTLDIDDDILPMVIPPMSLQPLVENAIKYGLGASLNPCHITITGAIYNEQLLLIVRDDGPGFVTGHQDGTGLSNLRKRLETVTNGAAEILVQSVPGDTSVSIVIPQD
jgi:signal transduction histidine kinase